ncbi:carbohydrate ABC transporter permease [Actinotalea caeni]|uniref:carbohydrate ABC transporter permease n=1 Tax=Actinotalea caeni TaxID=1348467 RepID=UPI0012E0F46C|nr:carbohydrate ABC transporter permease [Actinotalea caeni]
MSTTSPSVRNDRSTPVGQQRPRGPHLKNGQPRPHPAMQVVKGVAVALICAVIVMPFVGIVATSVAPPAQVSAAGGFVFWPEGIDLTAYRSILSGGVVTRSIQVSLFVTLVGTALALTTTALLAYALSRPSMPFRGFALGLVLLTLLFHPGMIPMYLAVKDFGLLDTVWAMIVPSMISGFNVIVMRAFFMNVPGELTDAARIDGAGELQIFTRIMLPLSKAILAVIGLFYAVAYWNSFFSALLYLKDSSLWPLQLVLRTYVVNNTALASAELNVDVVPPQASIQMAVLVVALVPILVVYPFLQKHFAKGVLTGAVKG